jgi:hypothetical protein
MNPVAHAEDSVEEPSTFVEIDVEAFGKTKVKVYEGFDFINQSSAECNWKLALNGAVLSKEIYDGQARDVYKTLGYDITWENISDDGIPGRSMAYKLLVDSNGNRKNIFAVAVRGTSTATDIFASDIVDGGTSMFSRTTSYIVEELKAFVTICTGKSLEELEGEENYFFFTGYSLGGAVANNLSIDGTVMKLAKNDKNRIYTYTFESPHTCIAFFWMNVGEMSNAFNLKDVDDPITNLPPYMWSTTYGKDVVFSVKDLSGVILKILYPETEYNDLTEYFWGWILPCPSHHNLIGDIVYILQQGQLVDEDYIEVNINHKEIPSVSRLSEVVSFVQTDETGPAGKMDSKEIYKYDDSGKLTERQIYSADGDPIGKETYVYDSKGKIKQWEMSEYYTMEDTIRPCILAYYTDEDGKMIRSQSIEEYTGAIRFSPDLGLNGNGGDGLRISYDEEGRVSNRAKIYCDTGIINWDYDFKYDESGTIYINGYPWWNSPMHDENERDDGSSAWERYVLQYDENGRLILLKEIEAYAYSYDNYTYDDHGRLISVEEFWNTYELDGIPGERLAIKNEFEYNEHGDLISEFIDDQYRYSFSLDTTGTISHQIDYYDNGQKKSEIITETPCLSGTPSYHYYFDEDGRITKYVIGTMSGLHLWTETVYSYDASGKLIAEESTDFEYRYDGDWTNPNPEKEISEIRKKYYIYEDYQ